MAKLKPWTSPARAANLVQHVHEEDGEGLGYALLRPKPKNRSTATTLTLATAKMNPVEPGPTSLRTRCGMATTARDHRLVLAHHVADPVSIEQLFRDYDLATPEHQEVLAAVFTVAFDRDRPLHDSFDAVVAWTMLDLARLKKLSSLTVLHATNDQLSDLTPHAHVLVLARHHHAAGWGALDGEFTESAHGLWAERWLSFEESWRKKPK